MSCGNPALQLHFVQRCLAGTHPWTLSQAPRNRAHSWGSREPSLTTQPLEIPVRKRPRLSRPSARCCRSDGGSRRWPRWASSPSPALPLSRYRVPSLRKPRGSPDRYRVTSLRNSAGPLTVTGSRRCRVPVPERRLRPLSARRAGRSAHAQRSAAARPRPPWAAAGRVRGGRSRPAPREHIGAGTQPLTSGTWSPGAFAFHPVGRGAGESLPRRWNRGHGRAERGGERLGGRCARALSGKAGRAVRGQRCPPGLLPQAAGQPGGRLRLLCGGWRAVGPGLCNESWGQAIPACSRVRGGLAGGPRRVPIAPVRGKRRKRQRAVGGPGGGKQLQLCGGQGCAGLGSAGRCRAGWKGSGVWRGGVSRWHAVILHS